MSSGTSQHPAASPVPPAPSAASAVMTPPSLHSWLGFAPPSARLQSSLSVVDPSIRLAHLTDSQVKAYSDSVYFNLYPAGLSLVFHPADKSYKPKTGSPLSELQLDKLTLASVDLYNHTATLTDPKDEKPGRKPSTTPSYGPYPLYPVPVSFVPSGAEAAARAGPSIFELRPETKGRELVAALGEPDRKGGGEGSMGIWVEWTALGLMVEFASGGLQAWDKGGDAVWRCASFFERGVQAGREDDDADLTV